jgi:hypothetical protein
MISMEELTRRRAYELWELAGRTGVAEEHWLKAESELAAAMLFAAPTDAEDRAPIKTAGAKKTTRTGTSKAANGTSPATRKRATPAAH